VTTSISGSRALVVGGAGFVGGNLVRLLLSSDVSEVVVVDNLLSSERTNVPEDPRVRFVEGSIADDSVLNGLPKNLDFVWHLACFHGNQSSIADPIADHMNNSLTSLKLFLHLSRTSTPTKVVYAAAGCAVAEKTYGDPTATPEDAPVTMFHDSPYSISKIVGELYGNYFQRSVGLPFVKARFQNVYGPGEILGAGKWRGTSATVWRNVVPTFIWKSIKGESLRLDNRGETSRDFIHVRDVCRGLVLCATRGVPGEAYNIASGAETMIRELAESINQLTGSKASLELVEARPWDRSGRRFGSTEKSELDLGFRSEIGLENGLRETVEWTRTNAPLIQGCIDRHAEMMSQLRSSVI
jgi:UDP-glucose 4-epimerase